MRVPSARSSARSRFRERAFYVLLWGSMVALLIAAWAFTEV